MSRGAMTPRLTTTSYAVLAQVAVRPWSTYELAQQRVRYFRYVWPRAESAIYREVKRLSSMGLLKEKKEHVGKRARTVYSTTEKGREALREWLATPVSPFAMDFEAMIRLFVAPLGTKHEIIATSSWYSTMPERCSGSLDKSNRSSSRAWRSHRIRPTSARSRLTSSSVFSTQSRRGRSGRWTRSNRGTTSAQMERTSEPSRSSGSCPFPRRDR